MLKRSVQHKYTKEQITFVETAKDTNGAYLLIEVSLPPNGDGPPLHVHDEFVEEFMVLSGVLTVTVGKIEHQLTAGQSITAPIGTDHTFTNNSSDQVVFNVTLTPPSQFEESVRIHYGLMDDNLTKNDGTPKNIFHLIAILKLQNTYIAGKSISSQRRLFSIIIGLGKLFGQYKKLEKYTEEKINI
ncbi:cupin domain-containing protein [Kurthia sibirica]|uniref:Cupin domain-containing protein n=1 Tax=Kurthia sibirica TaxID=202750 RepID=A0A2U3AQ42_9BACL|nr:cupin domain-containing protein [Kurthia sibirica]PWI26639.1 cupin domain-containing protein [Kurthia sibirica]GEK32897.1 hypothetical protein KSI01_04300 [Kurthia sibirica]